MSISVDGRDIAEVYLGSPNTNCITSVPKNINLTFDPLNVTVVGSPTINNGVVSGFSTANYLTLPQKMDVTGNKSWEIHTKFTYAVDDVNGSIFAGEGNQYIIFWKHATQNKIVFNVGNGSAWTTGDIYSNTILQNGQTYYYKLIYDGTKVTQYLSSDDKVWTDEGSWTGTLSIPVFTMRIGIARVTTLPFKGSIDLKESYIKINDQIWWKGGTGALTLKSGSKVYVPNGKNSDGSNRFDEVVIQNDIVNTNATSSDTYVRFLYYRNGRISYVYAASLSGTTPPTSGTNQVFYNTEDNTITRYTNGSIVDTNFSLPLAIVRAGNNMLINTIDQVFDWWGYIGSHQFFLPGIKGLKSNGFKSDGTYNNILVETDRVIVQGYGYQATNQQVSISGNGKSTWRTQKYYDQKDTPPVSTWQFWHNKTDNFNYVIQGDTSTGWVKNTDIDFVGITNANTEAGTFRITSMTPATVQPETTCIEIGEIYNGNDLVFSAFKPQTFTFNASTSLQTFVVPKNCTHLDVDCVASKGWRGGNTAGKGGRVQCRLSVTAGQTLYIYAGTIPTSGSRAYNASDIRTNNAGVTDTTSLQSRLVVAGGGGSSANSGLNTPGAGGQGGGLTGGNGGNGAVCTGAGGGTQTAGGARGGSSAAYPNYGSAGGFGLGGNGWSGGAGGAGWYGGGGGSGGGAVYSNVCSGGGGGSSYTNPSRCTNVTHTQGYRDDAGYVTITTLKIK